MWSVRPPPRLPIRCPPAFLIGNAPSAYASPGRCAQVVESCLEKVRKPAARIYEICSARTGVPLSRSIFLDDIPQNVKAARAAGMGVTLQVIETAEILRQSLEEHTGKGLILIDTPGLGPADVSAFAPLASVLSTHPEADVQLVVPAYLAPSAMASVARRFRAFLPSKLVITNTDCVESCLPAAASSRI